MPYEGITLPALFMKAPVAGPAPTVVVVNGMDNAKEMSIFFAGLEFARRGMHTLAMDGPGQGESLRLRNIHSRYDYEVPGAAAFDYVARRSEVDAKRVAIMGYSFGGYYSSRIAAFEKRYAACIALSALHWDLAGWQQRIKEKNRNDPKSVAQSNFQFQWVVDAATPDAAIEIAKKFSLARGRRRRARPRRQPPGRHRFRRRLAGGESLGSRMKFFTLSHHGKNQLHSLLARFRFLGRIKAIHDRIDICLVQGLKKRLRSLVLSQFLQKVFVRAGIPRRSVGGFPAAIGLCGFDCFQPGRSHCAGFGETLNVLGIYFRPAAGWTPPCESLKPRLSVEWFLLTVNPAIAKRLVERLRIGQGFLARNLLENA